jgi:hypothetical protein
VTYTKINKKLTPVKAKIQHISNNVFITNPTSVPLEAAAMQKSSPKIFHEFCFVMMTESREMFPCSSLASL